MNRANWKRIVIKVGSALIAPNQQGCSSHYLLSIAQFIVKCRAEGIQVVLVSSGSVAAGSHMFPDQENTDIAVKKAMAAAGQTEMISTWDKLFDFPSAQILLTHADLRDRERYVSIRETLFSLLDNQILPIVNENDTVTTDKLKVGDNDNLSAMVAAAADADALIICSDIDGLYDKNPHEMMTPNYFPGLRILTKVFTQWPAVRSKAAWAQVVCAQKLKRLKKRFLMVSIRSSSTDLQNCHLTCC